MEIKKVLNLSDEEFKVLIDAGTLLGSLRDNKLNYDELSDGVNSLLTGLQSVIAELQGENMDVK